MKCHFKALVLFIAAVSTSASNAHAGGCGRGGFGGFGGYGGGLGHASSPVFHNHYSAHQRPVYSQPAYAPPIYSVPTQPQPTYVHPAVPQSPTNWQESYPQAQGYPQAQSYPQQQSFSQAQSFSQQPGLPQQQSLQQQQGLPQQQSLQQQQRFAQQQAAPQLTIAQSPASSATQFTGMQQPTQSSAQIPAASMQNAPQAAPVSSASSGSSALELLSLIPGEETAAELGTSSIPEFSQATASSTNMEPVSHAGTWTVNLAGNQSVTLVLGEQGDFTWTAIKEGKSSSFSGQYRLEGERLTLVRSSDLQQMIGSFSGNASQRTFKLEGDTTSGLTFSRS
jgi:hypothetical protein